MGLPLEDVRADAGQRHGGRAKGSIDGASAAYTIYANDQLTKAAQYQTT